MQDNGGGDEKDRADQQDMAEGEHLLKIRQTGHLQHQHQQADPGANKGKDQHGQGLFSGEQAAHEQQQRDAGKEQCANGDVTQQHGVLGENDGRGHGIRDPGHAQKDGEDAQVEGFPVLAAGAQQEIPFDHQNEQAQHNAQQRQEQMGQVVLQLIKQDGEVGAQQKFHMVVLHAGKQGRKDHRDLFAAVVLMDRQADPVAADRPADAVFFAAGETVVQLPVDVHLSVVMADIKTQAAFIPRQLPQRPAVYIADADGGSFIQDPLLRILRNHRIAVGSALGFHMDILGNAHMDEEHKKQRKYDAKEDGGHISESGSILDLVHLLSVLSILPCRAETRKLCIPQQTDCICGCFLL